MKDYIKKHLNSIIISFIIIVIFFLSLGFASLNSVLNIDSLYATVRLNHDIRITKFQIENSENAISNYEDFNVHHINMGVSLKNPDSSISYRLTVTNFGNIPSGILKVDDLPDNLNLEFENYELKSMICDENNNCKIGMQKDIIITIKYNENGFNENITDYNLLLNIDFKPFFKVSFNSNNGDSTDHSKYVMFTDLYGSLYTPVKEGYTFKGWFLNGEKITESSQLLTEYDHTLEALWEPKKFTITFDPKGGTTPTTNKTVTYGETYGELPIPTKSGYLFDGWHTSPTEESKITSDTNVTITSNQTLYAHWRDYTLIITFDPNGGTTPVSNKKVTYESTYGDLPTPIREGFVFKGWYTSQTDGTYINADTKVSTNTDQTLYAHWSARCTMDYLINKFGVVSESGNPNFGELASTSEIIYTMPDDYGTSYYYRGTVTNNYLKFAGFYWRIIRINGDGSLRMIYDGQQAYPNGTSNINRSAIPDVVWNFQDNDNKYTGYMYGSSSGSAAQAQTNTNSSNVKTLTENWYKNNIDARGYSIYVVDRIFCNDRKIYSGSGYSNIPTVYAPKNRLVNNKTPKFTCTQKNDAFTVSDTIKGNGALTYPVGLVTADEINAAGGIFGTYSSNPNSAFYLYKGHYYWSMSSAIMDSGRVLYNFSVADRGNLDYRRINNRASISPVINLSLDYACGLTGSGTYNDPFRSPGISP